MRISILVLMILPLLAPSTLAQNDGCRKCDERGVVLCKKHDDDMHLYERQVQFCSTAAGCKECFGTLLVDCERCDGGPDSGKIPERKAEIEQWMAEERMAQHLGRPVPVVETPHFKLVVDTGTLKEGKKKKIDGHVVMHRVANDVEQAARLLGEHFLLQGTEVREASRLRKAAEAFTAGEVLEEEPASESDNPGSAMPASAQRDYFSKMRMWIWKNPDDHQNVMAKFLGSSSTGDFKMLGKDPVFSVWTEKEFGTVPGVRRLFTHNATHMLLSNLYGMLWTGDLGGGWFDAGSAHWYEYKIHELSVNYCIEEATIPLDFHGGVWRAPIRKWLKKDQTRFLPVLIKKNTGAMELPEQALCWSFYDYLIANHVESLPILQQGLKRKEEARKLLTDALGMRLLAIEDEWRAWVAATYPLKGDKPKEPKKPKR
jgi:hypothetical protein